MRKDISKSKRLDITKIRWGYSPAPLLPQSLRVVFKEALLPAWLQKELGLSENATIADLSSQVWSQTNSLSKRCLHYLQYFVRANIGSDSDLRCFGYPWPAGLKIRDIGWSVRTKNRLKEFGLLENTEKLMSLTFGELSQFDGVGAQVVLDFTCTLEGAAEYFTSLISSYMDSTQTGNFSESIEILRSALRKDWASQIDENDPRFSVFLSAGGRGLLSDRIDVLLTDPDGIEHVAEIPQLASALERIERQIAEIQKVSLEESLSNYMQLLSGATGERLKALLSRFGWDGQNVATLEEAGQLIGVTRERMRQLQSKVLKKIPEYEPFMPKLDEAIKLLEANAPMGLKHASDLLVERGITSSKFNVEALLETASSLHWSTSLQIRESKQGPILVTSGGQTISTIFNLARRLAGKSGVSSIYQVHSELEALDVHITENELERILQAGKTIDFLDSEWFWVTDIPLSRNRLRNLARKILSVVSPQSIRSIREGVRRNFKGRSSSGGRWRSLVVPPQNVMKAFFERHSEFTVHGDTVALTEPVDYRSVLGETDKVIVDVLRSAPSGLLDRSSFAEACISRGMNENTFSMFTSYSCVVEHVGVDIWKLRGLTVAPTTIEAFRQFNNLGKRERRTVEYGWDENGRLWIAAEIPKFNRANTVIYIPSSVSKFVINQNFSAVAKDNLDSCGTIVVTETGNSYGYRRFIQKFGLDENDILQIEFDLTNQTAFLSIGSEEMFFGMSS